MDFFTGEFGNYPTWWDNTSVRKYSETSDPVSALGSQEQASDSTCNGMDDDLSGVIDDIGGSTNPATTHCACTNQPPPSIPGIKSQYDVCNQLDDNCNEQIDEGDVCAFKCHVDTACESWETGVLRISSLFNAHAELPTPVDPWYSSGWSYGKTITLTPVTPSADYQVKVTLSDYTHMNTDGSDIRFYSTGGTKLNYWIEGWNNPGTSTIWVKVPAAGTSSIYMYYGNSGETSESNGPGTFAFFEDFEDGVLTGWKTSGLDSAVETGGQLVTEGKTGTWNNDNAEANKTASVSGDFYAEAKLNYVQRTSDISKMFFNLRASDGIKFRGGHWDAWETDNGYYFTTIDGVGSWCSNDGCGGTTKNTRAASDIVTIGAKRLGSTWYSYENGTLRLSGAGGSTADITGVGLSNARLDTWNGKTAKWYYVLIRKAAATEPSALLGSETTAPIAYSYRICCEGPVTLGTSCSGDYYEPFLGLSSTTNAHVEKENLGNYANKACLSGTIIGCGYQDGSCTGLGPMGEAACLASISADTNAHISNCTGSGSYSTKVCCWLGDNTPPDVDIDYSGPTGDHTVGEGEYVTYTATAADNPDGMGVSEVKIYVNGLWKKTCAGTSCSWPDPNPYYQGQVSSFYATAEDNAGNSNQSAVESFTVCQLDSVVIGQFDCTPYGCEQGNKVRIQSTFDGTTCPSPKLYVQVDARSSDDVCVIEAQGGDMIGLNGSCEAGSPCTGYWELPPIPTECEGKVVSATAASIRDNLNPATWRQFGWLDSPDGDIQLRGGVPVLVRVDASKLYVKSGQQITLYSETTGGYGDKRLDCSEASAGGLCSGTAASNPTCSFNSPWATDGEKVVQCWVHDLGSGKYSTNRTVFLRADNTPPSVSWVSPVAPVYRRDGASIEISADVTDPNIATGVPGAGVVNGANCNLNIDSATDSFTGSVLYSVAMQKCEGTITLNNPSGLPEGLHTLSMDIYDNATNTIHPEMQFTVDNTPPQAWIRSLPVWKNASSAGTVVFPVSWGGTDENSATGGALSFTVQYAVFDLIGTQIIGWTDTGSSTGNSTLVFGPDEPINPASYEGKNISFNVKATDQAGNYMIYERWGTVIDLTPPSCQMLEPYVIASGNKWNRNGFWFANNRYNVPWDGTDSVSGVASYDVNMLIGAGWSNIDDISYCNNTGLPDSDTSRACGIGMNNQVYNFSCRAIDAAGNVGTWSTENISVKVDIEPPMSLFNPLHEWIGRRQSEWLGSEYFNLSWSDVVFTGGLDDSGGSGVRCFYVRWSNSTTRADADPDKRWVNVTSDYNPDDPACLKPALSARYFEFGKANTILKDDETYNFSIRSFDNIGNREEWDESGTSASKVKNTTIDRYDPDVFSWIKDQSGELVVPGFLDPSRTTYVNITSNASDNISGIYSNKIYLTIVQRNLNDYISTNCSQSDCVGNIWSAPGHGGNTTCTVKVDYADGTTITYAINATDRANNTNSTTGVVTTHPLANFLVHLAVMSLGATVDIPAQVRNLEATTQNLTLGLDGFGMAAFLPADELAMLSPCSAEGRCANITLSPGEQRTIYVRVMANDITNGAQDLNITAVNDIGVVDNDTAAIVVGYPAEFPVMDAWWAVLLMMMFAAIMFYRTETSVERSTPTNRI